MKRAVAIIWCIFICISFFSFSLALEDITVTPSSPSNEEPSLPTSSSPDDTTSVYDGEEAPSLPEANNENKQLIADSTDAAKDAIDQSFSMFDASQQIILPEYLVKPTLFLFAIKDQTSITLDFFLILIILFVILYVILNDIIFIIFEQKLLSHLITLVLCCIASLIGTVYTFTSTLTLFASQRINNQYLLVLVVIIVLIVLATGFKLLTHLLHSLHEESKKEEAYKDGKRLRAFIEVAKKRMSLSQKR